jgi:magnesium chelatase subunit I
LIKKAVQKVFSQHFKPEDFTEFLQSFASGNSLEVSDSMPTAAYAQKLNGMPGLTTALERLNGSASSAMTAAALEFILEGLHLNKKLNKKLMEGEISYWG